MAQARAHNVSERSAQLIRVARGWRNLVRCRPQRLWRRRQNVSPPIHHNRIHLQLAPLVQRRVYRSAACPRCPPLAGGTFYQDDAMRKRTFYLVGSVSFVCWVVILCYLFVHKPLGRSAEVRISADASLACCRRRSAISRLRVQLRYRRGSVLRPCRACCSREDSSTTARVRPRPGPNVAPCVAVSRTSVRSASGFQLINIG